MLDDADYDVALVNLSCPLIHQPPFPARAHDIGVSTIGIIKPRQWTRSRVAQHACVHFCVLALAGEMTIRTQ